jgi:microcystin-dependent protein
MSNVQGKKEILNCGGVSIIGENDTTNSAGIIAYFAGIIAPEGWLIANGATISRVTYGNLFANIGTTYGAGDGSTTFKLPDLRGYFIRCLDLNAGIDVGRTLSSTPQQDAYLNHTHQYGIPTGGAVPIAGCNSNGNYNLNQQSTTAASTTGGTETRPKNMALLGCIKY